MSKTNNNATVQNEFYDPNWEIIHDYHNDQISKLQKEITMLHKAQNIDHGAIAHNNKQLKFHHQTCLRCLDTHQHKTVQDYTNWLMKNFSMPEALEIAWEDKEFSSMREAKDFVNALYAQHEQKAA